MGKKKERDFLGEIISVSETPLQIHRMPTKKLQIVTEVQFNFNFRFN